MDVGGGTELEGWYPEFNFIHFIFMKIALVAKRDLREAKAQNTRHTERQTEGQTDMQPKRSAEQTLFLLFSLCLCE